MFGFYFLNNFWLEKEILKQLLARLLMVHTIIYMLWKWHVLIVPHTKKKQQEEEIACLINLKPQIYNI